MIVLLSLAVLVSCNSDPLHNLKWKQITPHNAGPVGLGAHTMVIIDNNAYIWGGNHEDLIGNVWTYPDLHWRFNFDTKLWYSLATGPSGRAFHCVAKDEVNQKIYIYGGIVIPADFSFIDPKGDFWVYDIASNNWTEIITDVNPGIRISTQMVFLGGFIYMFGGNDAIIADPFTLRANNDLWRYSISSNTWTLIRAGGAAGSPPIRQSHIVELSILNGHNTLLISAGLGNVSIEAPTEHLHDTWYYDIQLDTFTNVTSNNLSNTINGGIGMQTGGCTTSYAINDPHFAIAFGGDEPGGTECNTNFNQNPTNKTFIFDFNSQSWRTIFPSKPAGFPVNLKRHSSDIYQDRTFMMWGGWSLECAPPNPQQIWNPNFFYLKFQKNDDFRRRRRLRR